MIRTFVLLSILWGVSSSRHPDQIESLPGLNFPLNYKHYSGYLNATKGRYLHYWFVESQRFPASDPLVLWLNGGPGCSSLDGMLKELGPLHISDDGKTLYNNTFSWNRVANVIFLESPAGVGFSYSEDGRYGTDDAAVAYDNYVALQHFFEKFPQFKRNAFYITGESYAGVYVPTLALRVLNGPAKINLKGYAIGNGYLDVANLTNSLYFFAYHHGLIAPGLWKDLKSHCCEGGIAVPENCHFGPPKLTCVFYAVQVMVAMFRSDLNAYNLYAKCAHSSDTNSRYLVDKRNLLPTVKLHALGHTPPCLDFSATKNYLNRGEVRKALHIPDTVQAWDMCSPAVEDGYKRMNSSMRREILQLAKSGIRGLVYNGDVDMMCNFLGDLWFVENLGLKVHRDYEKWYCNNQVAGYAKYYDKLTFLTVKGSGHMVPEDKPAEAFHMISKFLNNEWF